MATYSKETALYDTGAISDDIADAGAQVSKYITAIGDEGIKVHPYNATQGQVDIDNYAKIDSDGMEIWQKPEGADSSIKVAEFGADGAQIGENNKTHANVYSNSLELTDSAGTTFFKIRDAANESGQVTDTFVGDGETTQFTLSYTPSNTAYTVTQNGVTVSPIKTTTTITFSTAPAVGDIIVVVYNVFGNLAKAYDLGIRKTNTISGRYSVIEGYETIASSLCDHAEGYRTTASGASSHAEGYQTTTSGYASHAEGYKTIVSGGYSHAEGYETLVSGPYSHAEGDETTASGTTAHAEGYRTTASGTIAHAEGAWTIASGAYSHAEGNGTTASGYASHAEGTRTTASGYDSHAEGYETIAQRKSQTAIGEHNIADTGGTDETTRGDYVFIIGNGLYEKAPSNAFTVDWNGAVAFGDPANTFVVESTSVSVTVSTATAVAGTATATKSGYYPVGVVGFSVNSGGAYSRGCYLSNRASGSCTINFRLQASSTGAKNCDVYILWIKIA